MINNVTKTSNLHEPNVFVLIYILWASESPVLLMICFVNNQSAQIIINCH